MLFTGGNKMSVEVFSLEGWTFKVLKRRLSLTNRKSSQIESVCNGT